MTLEIDFKNLPLTTLNAQLTGYIITPDSAEYDEARAVWNGMIDHYPAVIVRCQNTQDVVATVNFARENALRLSVRGGGHNVAGSAVINNALVIDLSEMKAIEIDPQARIVQAQGGATWGDVDAITQQYKLAVPGGLVSETGIAGLTLGGGFGWLRNKYGLACDNLIGAEVVTSDGQVLHVNQHEHADLLWALRGGGGQFGVVTNFIYQAHPVGPKVMFTFVMYPGENAREALRYYRNYIQDLTEDVSSMAVLGHVPPVEHFPAEYHNKPFVLFGAAHAGDPEVGEKILHPLRNYATPIVDFSDIMPYVEMQKMWDEDYPSGELHYYWKSAYFNALSDEVIDVLIDQNSKSPSVLSTLDIWHLAGAVKRFDSQTSAFGVRDMDFMLGIESNWEDFAQDEANIDWARDVSEAMQPYSIQRRYLNFPGLLEDENFQETMFGENASSISTIKTKYDPINLFRLK